MCLAFAIVMYIALHFAIIVTMNFLAQCSEKIHMTLLSAYQISSTVAAQILRKCFVSLSFFCSERSWLEQGHKVGELVIPLARNFNNVSIDLESASNSKVCVSS